MQVEAEAAMAALEAGSREAASAQRLGALQQQLHEAQVVRHDDVHCWSACTEFAEGAAI